MCTAAGFLQGISTIAWACAALLHHPGELLEAIATDVARRPSDYAMPDWTNIIWAFTRLGRSPGRLYALLANEVSKQFSAVFLSLSWRSSLSVQSSCPLLALVRGGWAFSLRTKSKHVKVAPMGQACGQSSEQHTCCTPEKHRPLPLTTPAWLVKLQRLPLITRITWQWEDVALAS